MKRLYCLILGLFPTIAEAIPLDTIGTFCGTFPDQCRKGTEALLVARGSGTNTYYVMEVDPTTGALPISGSLTGTVTVSNLPTTVAVNSGATTASTLRVVLSSDSPTVAGRTYADSVRYTYVTAAVGVTNWVQLIASTAATFNCIQLFDSSGQTLELGTGAAASEARKMIIQPGGPDGCIPLTIPSGTRVSIRALSATTGAIGEIDITGFN